VAGLLGAAGNFLRAVCAECDKLRAARHILRCDDFTIKKVQTKWWKSANKRAVIVEGNQSCETE
jgi:hypothetical protein